MSYLIYVAENAHYMDLSSLYKLGEFDSHDEAVRVGKLVVDHYLASAWRPGWTKDQLYQHYTRNGEVPIIIPRSGLAPTRFSARSYAKLRCAELCGEVTLAVDAAEPALSEASPLARYAAEVEYEALLRRLKVGAGRGERRDETS
jgi:hypothetical protein